MKKVHMYDGQQLHEDVLSHGRGLYWFMAPCGTTVTVRASRRDLERGVTERRLRDAWRFASADRRCSKCAKKGV